MSDGLSDYLAPERAIVARLDARLPSGWRVLTAPDLTGVEERSQPMPAAQVIYAGDQSVESLGQGGLVHINQLWLVVLCVRNVSDIRSGEGVRSDVGVVIPVVYRALAGWRPAPHWGRMMAVTSPFRATYREGRAYFPIAFETKAQVIDTEASRA